MRKFRTLSIREISRPTPDSIAVAFAVPETLRGEFRHKQGQHVSLRTVMDGEELRRCYSVTSIGGGDLRIVIRKVEGGRFSKFANENFKPGSEIEVLPPMGQFNVALDAKNAKHYIAFAGGIGITPIISLIRTTLDAEPKSRFTLFYANRSAASTVFREEILELKNKYIGRFAPYFFFTREKREIELFNGRIDARRCAEILDRVIKNAQGDEFFLCAPEGMSRNIADTLEKKGIARERIHIERFNVGSDAAETKAPAPAAGSAAEASELTLVLDGFEHKVSFAPQSPNILSAAEEAGIDAPFSCRDGVCGTCRAKLLEGEVEMCANYCLEDDQVAAGFILTCQSVPKTKRVVLSYDE